MKRTILPTASCPSTRTVIIAHVLLSLSVLGCFWNLSSAEFILYDDQEYVFENPHITGGITPAAVAWALTHGHSANWHPLTWISHMLDWSLFGPNAGMHHFVNVLIHLITANLLLFSLFRMTGAFYGSVFLAFLFALHPMHVESVAWVSERKDVLAGMFWVMTMIFYVEYVRKRRLRLLILTYAIYCLGLVSKPMLVTLPCALLLLDFWPLGRFAVADRLRLIIAEKVPMFLAAAASSILTVHFQGGAVAGVSLMSIDARVANAIVSYCRYLWYAVFPVNLSVFYPMRPLDPGLVVGCGFLLLGISAAAVWKRRSQPWLLTGWFWFLGTLFPVIGIIQVGSQAFADRYTYLPYIGLFIAATWSLARSMGRMRRVAALGAAAVLVLCATGTTIRVSKWHDTKKLFTQALSIDKNNYLALKVLGIYYKSSGDTAAALEMYERSLAIKSHDPDLLAEAGTMLKKYGKTSDALYHLQAAIAIDPCHVKANNNIGSCFADLGLYDSALAHFKKVLEVNRNDLQALQNLSIVFLRMGRYNDCISCADKVLAVSGNDRPALYNRAQACIAVGRFDKAAECYKMLLRQERSPVYLSNLGIIALQQGDHKTAQAYFHQAIAADSAHSPAYMNMGTSCAMQGRIGEAIGWFRKALALNPADTLARTNLARALADRRKR